jgi:Histidine kinase
MRQYPFIFSTELKYRFRRHFLFWFCWWIFQSFLYSFVFVISEIPYWYHLQIAAIEALLYLTAHMFLSYSLMYGVVPRLILKGRYLPALFAVVGLFLITAVLSAGMGLYLIYPIRQWVLPSIYKAPIHPNYTNVFLALLAGLRGAITIGGLAAAIKIMKYWYIKEQQNLQLQKENIAAQLNLLKAQVHPHFLFNTLNNIYAHTQTTSPAAAKLVLGLSDLLRYMLYECRQEKVSLQQELKMLKEYMLLEQARYDDRLDIILDMPEQEDDYAIAPLLLLPLVENCFKHGTSTVIKQPWIHLSITIDAGQLHMKLANGKQLGETAPPIKKGIGIANVQQRLQLLYTDKHTLRVFDEEAMFVVSLKLQLERPHAAIVTTASANKIAYAGE